MGVIFVVVVAVIFMTQLLAFRDAADPPDLTCNVVGKQLLVAINNFALNSEAAFAVLESTSYCKLL